MYQRGDTNYQEGLKNYSQNVDPRTCAFFWDGMFPGIDNPDPSALNVNQLWVHVLNMGKFLYRVTDSVKSLLSYINNGYFAIS